jgi:FecR protein
MISRVKQLLVLSLATLCAPAFGANPARPGTINYIEGSAFLAGEPVTQKSVGSVELDPCQVLSTQQGKAEVLLTPGIYLRLDDDSSVRMISPDLTSTQLELQKGRATVEVDEIHPQNDVQIVDAGVPTQLLKTGLYEFNADNDTASVFSGKAAVHEPGNRWVVIKSDHELALNEGPREKPQHFGKSASEDELYNWSSLRSEYLSEANVELSGSYAGYAPGWYWDPWLFGYTFMGPYPFYSPFGWGFYPFGYYGGMGFGYYGGGRYYGRGFRGGDFGGGGFHGGGGGFHGGGGGGHR